MLARSAQPLLNDEVTNVDVMRFRKPRLGVKSDNFDFSAKSSSTDHNESSKPTPKSLAHIGSEKSLVQF